MNNLKRVDLPAPFTPTKATLSLSFIVKLASLKITFVPNDKFILLAFRYPPLLNF